MWFSQGSMRFGDCKSAQSEKGKDGADAGEKYKGRDQSGGQFIATTQKADTHVRYSKTFSS